MTTTLSNAAGERIAGPVRPGDAAELLDVRRVAEQLGCSVRHVRRLADAGRMPRPLKLGALLRWRRLELSRWIQDGCPDTRRAAR